MTAVYAVSRTPHRRSTVELDTIYAAMVRIVGADHPMTLRALVRDCIERHVNPAILHRTQEQERLERDSLADLASGGWT